MTRINAAIPVEKLCNEHLLAEHREIKRIPNVILSGRFNMDGLPETFKLGTGHVKFFYNKLEYLYDRYISLYFECLRREFNVQDFSNPFEECRKLHPKLFNNWIPDKNVYNILVERINERLDHMKKPQHKLEYV